MVTPVGFGDADSFYASAEIARRPWMGSLPIGVLGNQGACVIARNRPMKKAGVTVGEPIWEAKRKCPDGVYVKRDFRWYETLSRRMLAEIRENFSPRVEYHSIDEFFWQADREPQHSYQQTAVAIRDHIKSVVGVPMTVAFARTRTLAKLFADTSKPFGAVAVLDRDHERHLLARLPVTEIAGIARRRAARLEPYGIRTCLDLADAEGRIVKHLLTATGHDLWLELNGTPVTPIRPAKPRQKTVSRGGSLAGRVHDPRILYGWVVRNLERLVEELHFHELRPKTLTVLISYFEQGTMSGTVRLGVPTDRFDTLLEAAKVGLRRAWRPGWVGTHLHLIATDLVPPQGWTRSLFDEGEAQADAIARVKREINEQFGRFKIRSGSTLYANDFYDDPANEYDVCDIRGKFCF